MTSENDRVFIIAEAGSNWRSGTPARDLAMARALIQAAAEAGADAIKFQTYRAHSVYVPNAGASDYLSQAGIRQSITDIFEDLSMPYEMIPELAAHCSACGIKFMSSPFSVQDAKAVDPFVEIHKIASYEISHSRLIEFMAGTGKPLILSTGACEEQDIAWALDHFRAHGGRVVTLMQCTARYPAPPESLNLRAIPALRERFGVPVGLSDHSRDPITGPAAAVALGATIIEKHFTLHNALPGPDHPFAITPGELRVMVQTIRNVEKSLGTGRIEILEQEQELRLFARRGLQALGDISKGQILREGENFDILRPGKQRAGAHPRHLPEIQGRSATRDIPAGDGIHPLDAE